MEIIPSPNNLDIYKYLHQSQPTITPIEANVVTPAATNEY
jgi:hypothetical protein